LSEEVLAWTTADEVDYMRGLAAKPDPRRSLVLLFDYLDSLDRRRDFGAIDRGAVVEATRAEIRRVEHIVMSRRGRKAGDPKNRMPRGPRRRSEEEV